LIAQIYGLLVKPARWLSNLYSLLCR